MKHLKCLTLAVSLLTLPLPAFAQANPKLAGYKTEAVKGVDEMAKLAQEMVDSVFSFGELGFQEFETSRYLTGQLEKFGFTVQRGVAGIPTAWVAKWGSGKPVIALGSDIDGIPQASQKPGVAYADPIIVGAPGHGEGHGGHQGQAEGGPGGHRHRHPCAAGQEPRVRQASGRLTRPASPSLARMPPGEIPR